MDTIALTINDRNVGCKAGSSILDAAADHGIRIPSLCHHPELKPHGACRLCLVEDEDSGRLMAACVTPAAANMKIRTDTERVVNHRRNIVRLMIAEHPESCILCSKGNRCRLRQTAAELGIGETDLYPMPNYKTFEQANPFIVRDLSKCILCGKCIRADHELVVVGAIDYNLRGFQSRPATVHDQPLEKSSCTFCGTCVSMCPTGALAVQDFNYIGTPETTFNSICGFCAVGCSLELGVGDNKIVEINPANFDDSVNRATLCVRGHFAHDYLNTPHRLVSPKLRSDDDGAGDKLAAVKWQPAIDEIAQHLLGIKKTNGPQSIAFIGSAKCSLEENYLLQKIARTLIGTHNLDYGSYTGGQPLTPAIDQRTSGRWRTNSLDAIEQAEAIFLIGADPGHSLPVVGYHIKRAVKRGVPLVVADPRRTELARAAAHWLPVNPGNELTLINTLAAILLADGACDAAFIDRNTEGFSLYRLGLSGLDPGHSAQTIGVKREELEATARLLCGRKTAWIAGSGFNGHLYAGQMLDAIVNISLVTGNSGSDGSGLYLLPEESNSVGAADMGVKPDLLPGRVSLTDKKTRRFWEKAWGIKISPDPGLSLLNMVAEAEKGNLKALYIMGENPLRALPQQDRVRAALNRIEFLVVQDILDGETTQQADAILPGASFAEKSGAFTNLEGRIQTFTPAISPPGLAMPDWRILNLLSASLGNTTPYESIASIREEIADLIPMYADLKTGKSGWVRDSAESASGARARPPIAFTPVVSDQETTAPDKNYPYTAFFGVRRFHIGSGTRSGYSQRINAHPQSAVVEISPVDAVKMDLNDGEHIELFSAHGSISRKVLQNSDLRPGQLFVPLAVAGNEAVNLLPFHINGTSAEVGRLYCPVGLKKISPH